jgi:hypothetical protein
MSDHYTSTVNRRDSGVEIENSIMLKKELLEPSKRAAAGDNATKSLSDDINYNTINLKRASCDADAGWTSNAETAIKKRKHDTETAIKLRVLCPFYKLEPRAHTRKISCFHQGFPTVARLKQHLVKIHDVPKSKLAFIKSNGFKQLGSIEAKWRHVFRNLFPAVSEDDVPSPCKYSSPSRASQQAHECLDKDVSPDQGSIATNQSVFEDILERGNSEPNFAAEISNMRLQALGNHTMHKSPTANFGLQTPSTSAESSPELRNLDATSSFDTCLKPMSPNSNCMDPLLFSSAAPDSPFTFDMACAWEQYDKSAETVPSVYIPTDNTGSCNSVCKDCMSQNVFRTKGTGPHVDVCGDCHSTDILYPTVVVPIEDKAQSGHADGTSMEVPDHFQGLGEDIMWVDDFAGHLAVNEEDLREDIDELFEL